tara:strand:+ start:5054 stop:5668 length:615 start_codon:yes stop_codon:yes gene_type:complete
MKDVGATFDKSKQSYLPIEAGKYPAHISSVYERELNTKAGKAIVVNMSYDIAEDVKDITQKVYKMDGYDYELDKDGNKIPVNDKDGKPVLAACKHLSGKQFRDNGTFLFLEEKSAGKNGRYYSLLQNLGIEVKEDGKLPLVEEDDVIGLPVFVTLKSETYVTKDTKDLPEAEQEVRTAWKVDRIDAWADGVKVSKEEMEEDLPF